MGPIFHQKIPSKGSVFQTKPNLSPPPPPGYPSTGLNRLQPYVGKICCLRSLKILPQVRHLDYNGAFILGWLFDYDIFATSSEEKCHHQSGKVAKLYEITKGNIGTGLLGLPTKARLLVSMMEAGLLVSMMPLLLLSISLL